MEQNYQNILIVQSKIILKPQSTGSMGLVWLKLSEGPRSSIQERVGYWQCPFREMREGRWTTPALYNVPVLSTGNHYRVGTALLWEGRDQLFKSKLCEFACPRSLRFKALRDYLVTFSFYRLSAKQWFGMQSWYTDLHRSSGIQVGYPTYSEVDTHGHT